MLNKNRLFHLFTTLIDSGGQTKLFDTLGFKLSRSAPSGGGFCHVLQPFNDGGSGLSLPVKSDPSISYKSLCNVTNICFTTIAFRFNDSDFNIIILYHAEMLEYLKSHCNIFSAPVFALMSVNYNYVLLVN